MPGGVPVGEAFVTVRPDTRGFAGEAEAGIGAPMRRLVGAIAAMFVAARVKEWISGWIAEAQEATKVEAQTGAVIKSTGGAAQVTAGHVGAYAEKLASLTGIDDEVIQKGQNMLLTFTNIRNEVGAGNNVFDQATQTMLDMSAALGQDASASAMQLGKALNDPINGVTALRRVGVQLTDQQKAQIDAFVKSGDILSAQKIILAELAKEFGGSAAAQATAADRMKVIWGNLKEDLGKAIMPAFEQIFPALQGLIAELAPAVQPLAEMLGQGLGGAFQTLIPVVQAFLPVLQALFPVVMSIGEAFAPLIPAVAELAASVAEALIPVIEAFIPILEPLIAALARVFTEVAKSGALQELGLAFVAVIEAVMPLIPVIVQLIEVLTPIIVLAAQIAAVLIEVLAAAITALVGIARAAWSAMSGAFQALGSVISSVYGAVIRPIIDAFNVAVQAAKNASNAAWKAVESAFRALGSALKWVWENVIRPVYNAVKDAANFIAGVAGSVAGLGGASGGAAGSLVNRPPGKAVGGYASGLTRISERGGEILRLPTGTYVYPHAESMRMLADMMGRGTNVTVEASALERAAAMLQRAVMWWMSTAPGAYDAVTAARTG